MLPRCDGALQAVLWRILVNQNPTRALQLDPDAPAEKISLPAATPWKEAAQRFTASTKNAELAVE